MQPSKHNILTKTHGDERWLLADLLSGGADVLEPAIGERLSRGEISEIAAKGYLVDPEEELLSLGGSDYGKAALAPSPGRAE